MKQSVSLDASNQPSQIMDKNEEKIPQITVAASSSNFKINKSIHCASCGQLITPEMQLILQKGEDCFCEFCGQQVRLPE